MAWGIVFCLLNIDSCTNKPIENWSWELSGSVSWSYSQTDDRKRYPLQYLISPDKFNRHMNGLSPEDREDMMRLYYQEHDAIDEGFPPKS